MKLAALYIRVSTDDQIEYSPDAQRRLLTDFAKKNNYSVSNQYIFIDDGISGKRAEKRPQFQKMIGMAKSKEHPFDVILVWKYSRFARNQEESIVYKSLLKKNSVDVISITEPIIDGPFGTLIERIIEWMDEYYSIRLSEEVKKGMTEKALRGEYQAGAPFGYTLSEGRLLIDEGKALIVNKIYDLYLNHSQNFFSIARMLNDMGVKTNRGNQFENRTVKYIIQNPIYKGFVRWNPNGKTDLREQKNILDDIIIKKGDHNPIVSESTWDKANKKLLSEFRSRKSKPNSVLAHWLGGLIVCSNCNSALVSSGSKSGGYQCNSYSKGKCNESHYVSYNKIENAVIKTLKELIQTGEFDYEILVIDENKDKLDMLKRSVKRLEIKESRIKDAYINGIDSIDEYKANKNNIQKEREYLQQQMKSIKNIKKTDKTKDQMIYNLKTVYAILISDADKEAKSNAIRSAVKKIVYNKKLEHIDVYLYYS
ncbi:recombinase family protein [Mobilitalea sibirica]|uniref:Recombinase family protein n=1 Tax=Mobilitalea sibirica TaxID=1462919 RepID=A0A8J7H5L9_9FIRM|nr:recombinase family protein [Mobilitalea sibirica]MBH1941684.1 recombinase family protein [Mobilitalea sibirica]